MFFNDTPTTEIYTVVGHSHVPASWPPMIGDDALDQGSSGPYAPHETVPAAKRASHLRRRTSIGSSIPPYSSHGSSRGVRNLERVAYSCFGVFVHDRSTRAAPPTAM